MAAAAEAAEVAAAAEAKAAAIRATRLSQANTIVATDVIVDSTSIDVSFEKSSPTTPQYTSASKLEVILDDDFQSTVSEVVVELDSDFDNDVDDDGNDMFRTIVDASDEEEDEEPNLLALATLYAHSTWCFWRDE